MNLAYYEKNYDVELWQAGLLTALFIFPASLLRPVGGWISDRWGGVNTLSLVLLVVAATLTLIGFSGQSLVLTTLLMMVCFAALGAGNGALFQLVPLRWPTTTAVAGSMIGELGALGGGLVPGGLGLSKQYLGSYAYGFFALAALALVVLFVMRVMQIRWTRTWAEKGGRARLRPTQA